MPQPKVITLSAAQKAEITTLQAAVTAAEPAFKAAQGPYQKAQQALKAYLNAAAGLPARSFQRVQVSKDGDSLVVGMV